MYQQTTIVGYLGSDPVMRFTPNGKEVTNFSVATSRKYTGSNGQQVDETTWFRVTVWGAQAESCNTYLKKGRPVLVVGRLVPDLQTGNPKVFSRQDGIMGSSFELSASWVQFLPSRDGANGNGGNFTDPDAQNETEPDEIPF